MPKDSNLILRDMLAEVQAARAAASGLGLEQFAADPVRQRAVFYSLLVIGEAAGRLPEDFKQQYPQVPWRQLKDLRNVMAHEYDTIELETVWSIVSENLPELEAELRPIVSRIE
jgi:uncharacterized protein with HEPN domain